MRDLWGHGKGSQLVQVGVGLRHVFEEGYNDGRAGHIVHWEYKEKLV